MKYIEAVGFSLILYLLFYLVAFGPGLAISIFIFRKEIKLDRWDALLIFLPGLVWCGFVVADAKGKTLSNAVAEPIILGVFGSLVFFLKCGANKFHKRQIAWSILATLTISVGAFLLWCLMPGLSE